MENNNPLLDFSGLPRFNEIKPEHIEPAVDYMLNRNRNQIAKLTALNAAPIVSVAGLLGYDVSGHARIVRRVQLAFQLLAY